MPKKPKVRFGSAGIPHQCKGGSFQAIECSNKLGLDAMELEFVRGVKLKEENARKLKAEAETFDIRLSAHAPYWINCCAEEKEKQDTSLRNLFAAAEAASWAGARVAVFHPGYYQERPAEECFRLVKNMFEKLREKMDEHEVKNVKLGAETVGKKSQFGGLDECIQLHLEIPEIMLVLDFAHLHARGDWKLLSEDDYASLFDHIEKHLPEYLKDFHGHFSCVQYSERGELNHLPLEGNNEPKYEPLMKVLAEQGYSGVIISESPMLEFDALKMKKEYLTHL